MNIVEPISPLVRLSSKDRNILGIEIADVYT
jgi:hypothetical protein